MTSQYGGAAESDAGGGGVVVKCGYKNSASGAESKILQIFWISFHFLNHLARILKFKKKTNKNI